MECPLSQKDILFNLSQGLGYEERSLALYEEYLAMLEGKELSDEESYDRDVILRIAEDEKRHIDIVKNLIHIVEESYTEA
jgi:rubrerythrin